MISKYIFPKKGFYFIDTSSISKDRKIGICIITHYPDKKDSSEKKGKIFLLMNSDSGWYAVDTIKFHYDDYHDYPPFKVAPEFIDINNDKIKDIFIFKGYGGKGGGTDSDRYFDIFLIDKKGKKFTKVKYQREIVNPIYFKKRNFFKIIYEAKQATIFVCKLRGDRLVDIKSYTETNN